MGSDFLFVTPTFLLGAASVLDIGGTLTGYNTSKSELEADTKAIRSDWQMVGHDICNALIDYKRQYAEEKA